jgi:pimeloyl-ACP methyl ester carboxylesterase
MSTRSSSLGTSDATGSPLSSAPQRLQRKTLVAGATIGLATLLGGCGGDGTLAPVAAASTSTPQPQPQASAENQCNAFLGRSFEGATVTRAALVPASATVPEYCIVLGEMSQDLDFEVRMPTDWNHRTVFTGGGGFDGVIADPGFFLTPFSPGLPNRGYATIATNHGHNEDTKPGATFALDAEMLTEYAYLAVPRVLAPAKAILRARYGDSFASAKLVYEGCSGGGRQALIQAQRFPDLFDGVISRAPANAYTSQFLRYQQVLKPLAKPGATLGAAKTKAIANAVYAKCDALDGLKDNIIGRPEACQFDPVELACSGTETDSCLTPAQVESARTFYAPTNIANGRHTWPGFLPGGEDGSALGGPAWGGDTMTALMEGFIKYMVAQNGAIDPLQLDPAQYGARLDQLASMIDAVNPDLSRFRARGGKLLLWTGQTDWLITANNATDYYKSVVQKNGGQTAADEFVEYYTAPGVNHCALGTGADKVDLAGPMFEWLEKGIKPSTSTIIATQFIVPPGAAAINRPLCKYPQYPKYISGDPNTAASFVCTAPPAG